LSPRGSPYSPRSGGSGGGSSQQHQRGGAGGGADNNNNNNNNNNGLSSTTSSSSAYYDDFSHMAITPAMTMTTVAVQQEDMNPLKPCGACTEWLKKIAEVNPSFMVLSFTDESCTGVYVESIFDSQV
jgi:hypothetical protein